MAFLCPSRRSRQKKKEKEAEKEPYLGRITGSASVDTLVRVGLEKQHGLSPEARMTVVDDFAACASDELNVARGQTVYMLYTEQEWMYVLMEDGREGFIPRSFAKPCRSPALRKRVPPTPLSQIRRVLPPAVGGTDDEGNDGDQSNSPTNSSSQAGGFPDASMPEEDQEPHTSATASDCEGQQGSNVSEQEDAESNHTDLPDVLPFGKRAQGKWVVMFSCDVEQESDVRVSSGEVVTLLNADDKDWFWIRRSGGQEGFVPRGFLCKLPDDFRITDTTSAGFRPVTKKPPVPNHHRSQSMTDPPVSLPAYLKPPPQPPPPQPPAPPPKIPEPSSGVYNIPRATAAFSTTRHRPHSSMGFPVSSSSSSSMSLQQSSVPLTATNSEQNVPVRPSKERPHSSVVGHPMKSSLSQSHDSLPQAVSSEESCGVRNVQRPHSSMGYPVTSSTSMNQHPHSPSFPGVQAQFSSFPAGSQRMQGSVSHTPKPAWTSASRASGINGGVANSSGMPASAPVGYGASSDSAPVLREHQTVGRFEQTSNAVPAGLSRDSGHPPPPPLHPLSTHGSVSHPLSPPPPRGPQSPLSHTSPSHTSLHSSPTHPPPLPPSSGHPRSPPTKHSVRSNHITNRFRSGQAGSNLNPPQLTRSLNHSQDGRRAPLMHQLSAPELLPASHDLSSAIPSRDVQGRHSSYESTNDTNTDVRLLQSQSHPHSRPRLGEVGRSKSSSRFPEPPIPDSVTELMTLHSFSSRGVDDISVSSGEVVYGDLDRQPERDWLWVYSPKLHRHGYIPRGNVRLPGDAGDFRSENVTRV